MNAISSTTPSTPQGAPAMNSRYYVTNAAGLYLTHGMKFTGNRALAWAFTDADDAANMSSLVPGGRPAGGQQVPPQAG